MADSGCKGWVVESFDVFEGLVVSLILHWIVDRSMACHITYGPDLVVLLAIVSCTIKSNLRYMTLCWPIAQYNLIRST